MCKRKTKKKLKKQVRDSIHFKVHYIKLINVIDGKVISYTIKRNWFVDRSGLVARSIF